MELDLSNDTMLHVKKGNIEYLQFRKLLEYEDEIIHAYTLKPLDFDTKNPNQENNIEKIEEALGIKSPDLVQQKQTHSDHIKIIEQQKQIETKYLDTDGIITNQKNAMLLLRYADCIPLLFWDPKTQVIANIHSGWKGSVQKIGLKAVKKMTEELGCNKQDLICCIGPSIGKCHFEVEQDVVSQFQKAFPEQMKHSQIMQKGEVKEGRQKYYIDTVKLNALLLEEAGLSKQNIIQSNICTVCHNTQMHSYRIGKQKAGRNAAIIYLKGGKDDTK